MKVRIEKPLLKSLTIMASVIEARDAYTGGHLWRVSQYAQRLAESGGLTTEMVFLASLGGFLHDIGKIGVPEAILGKRGELTTTEYEVVKTHPGIGATLIQEHPLADLATAAIRQHHEWVNGTGYPDRLHATQISIFARIVSIADAFDALTSSRPYRQGVATQAAVAALQIEYGSQFDAHLLDTFVQTAITGALEDIVGHSDHGVPMVKCPNCGPVITVSKNSQDGDLTYCRICGTQVRLHRKASTFEVEPSGNKATAEQLKPRPDPATIEAFIARAPVSVSI